MKTFQDLKKTLLNKNPFKRFTSNANGNLSACNTPKHFRLFDNKHIDEQLCVNVNNSTNNHEQIFCSHYIGNTILSYDSSNEGNASNCINRIVETSKLYKNKNRKKVLIKISIKGFKVLDCDTSLSIIDASIYRISYVTISKTHKNVYAFIYQNPMTKLIECHAFDCKSKSYAKLILRNSFIAFNLAYERYYNEKDLKKRALLLEETQAFSFDEYNSIEAQTKEIQITIDRRSSILSKMCAQEARNNSYYGRKWINLSRTNSCKTALKARNYSKLENSEDDDFDLCYDDDDDDDDYENYYDEISDNEVNHDNQVYEQKMNTPLSYNTSTISL